MISDTPFHQVETLFSSIRYMACQNRHICNNIRVFCKTSMRICLLHISLLSRNNLYRGQLLLFSPRYRPVLPPLTPYRRISHPNTRRSARCHKYAEPILKWDRFLYTPIRNPFLSPSSHVKALYFRFTTANRQAWRIFRCAFREVPALLHYWTARRILPFPTRLLPFSNFLLHGSLRADRL